MRRKKDDKRVLRRGNGRDSNSPRRSTSILKRNSGSFSRNRSKPRNRSRNANNAWSRNKKQKKRSRKTVLLMIIVLIAFIVGAGIGILMSFDDGSDDNETHVKNVTVEMTTHLNETEPVIYDENDEIDFNENQTSEILDADKNPYYYDDGLEY